MSIEYQEKTSLSPIGLQANLLLVNDSRTPLKAMSLVLAREGYSVFTADCAESALEMLDRESSDLIITDVVMPGMGGIELCRRLKSKPATADIPVLLVSSLRNDYESLLEGYDAGADEFLQTGFPPSLLIKKVGRLIAQARANKARLKAEERFSKAFNASPVPMSIVSYREGRYIDVNESFLRNCGYTREEIIGRTTTEINLYADPGERDRLRQILKREGRIRNAEVRRRVKSGELRVALASSEVIYLDGEKCILTTTNDITERRQLEQQLIQSQKMDAIGRLAGGVAHDFNNLLTAIIGYSEIVKRRLDEDDPMREQIEEIEKAGHRAASLTNQLLAFSRKQVLQPQVLDLNAVIADISNMLKRLIGEDIELRTNLDPSIGYVKVDPGQIDQIIMNLAVNARDAMPRGGKLTIETQNVYLDETYTNQHAEVQAGPYVMLAISDTGIGMDRETQARVFEPFFTTKERGKGTGLGLSTVFGIVRQSGGHVWVYSEPGRGTTFKVYLPLVEQASQIVQTWEPRVETLRGTETVLLVEDEEAVRKLAHQVLDMNGYKVLVAADPAEALRLCRQHEGPIHLMITDVVMPGMSGRELAERLIATRPEMELVYMSGYTDDAIVHHGVLDAGVAFLQKPFTPDALGRKVREILDAPQL
jgi:PAS domain S-box-containing protein